MNVTVNGVDIFYEVRGHGPAVVMVHGNSEDHHTFDSTADILQEHYTLYMPDSRGHGLSGKVDEFHYADMADDVADFIDAMGLDKPMLIGFSDGGIIGLMVAYDHPGKISNLVACGPNSKPEALGGWFGFMCRHSRKMKNEPKVRMMLEEPHMKAEELGRIDIPTLILTGSRDCIDRKDIDFIASSIPGAKKIVVKGEGHGTYIENSDKLANIVLKEFGTE